MALVPVPQGCGEEWITQQFHGENRKKMEHRGKNDPGRHGTDYGD